MMEKYKKAEIVITVTPYQATESEQISLEEGDIIEIGHKSPDNYWWHGQKVIGKQSGWFPASCVKSFGNVGITAAGLGGTLRGSRYNGVTINTNETESNKPPVSVKPIKVVASAYEVPRKKSVSRTNSTEHVITLPSTEFKSHLEKVLNKDNILGQFTNQKTIRSPQEIPLNLTTIKQDKAKTKKNILTQSTDHNQNGNHSGRTTKSSSSSLQSYQIVVAIAVFEATDPANQLCLQIGDLIRVHEMTEEDETTGWWHGEILKGNDQRQQRNTSGWFPISYVKTLTEEYSHFIDEEGEESVKKTKVKEIYDRPKNIKDKEKVEPIYIAPIPPQLPPKKKLPVPVPDVNYEYEYMDDSFDDSDDDSDYGTDKTSGSIVQIKAIKIYDSNGNPRHKQPTQTTQQQQQRVNTIAVLSLAKIEAVQLYTKTYPLKMYLKVTIATDWQHANTILTTSTVSMKKPHSFRSMQQYYTINWSTNFRMNIYNSRQSLLVQCFDASNSSHTLSRKGEQNTNQLIAEASLPLDDLIKQSKHLNNFTKGLPLNVLSDKIETTLPNGQIIKPCLLVKFEIVDLR